jgi:hypothetical protein
MPEIFLTYDVRRTTNTIHTELKSRLINHYHYVSTVQASNGRAYDLPNTTVRKINTTAQQCATDFVGACRDIGAIWERYIAIEMTTWTVDNQNP